TPAEQVAALRAQFVEKLDEVRAELQAARDELPERNRAYATARADYEALTKYVLTPLRRTNADLQPTLETLPAAPHGWLTHDAHKPIKQAQAALRQLERQIAALEQNLGKWQDEVSFLDRVLVGDKVSSVRLVVARATPRVVEFDNITMPREG